MSTLKNPIICPKKAEITRILIEGDTAEVVTGLEASLGVLTDPQLAEHYDITPDHLRGISIILGVINALDPGIYREKK